ncbi:MAG: FtsQ-type POTRA domain-containing protein [Clostridia bacterium]|nr:FtsQ-type POTRA domain-containing protein [Clostridia bacterium]
MNGRIQKEYAGDVLYVYDRICPKQAKNREIDRTYGKTRGHTQQHPPSGTRQYGKAFAEGQRRRASAQSSAQYRQRQQTNRRGDNASRREASGQAYTYRPQQPGGGEAVRSHPLKLMLDRIINFFESVEERGRRDEAIAKQRAIAWKKYTEYRHIIWTTIALIAVTVLFGLLVYKLFFVIEDVAVTGSERYTAEEVLASTGFALGDNLYSFAASDAENAITFYCPHIRSAEITRTVPKTVSIAVEEDMPAYWTVIWGDCVMLSEGLRVLGGTDAEQAKAEGLTELILPPVQYSVAGRVLVFSDQRNERFIRAVLTEVRKSELMQAGMVDEIDLSDAYDITVDSMGRYLLRFGGEEDFDLKLRMAYRTMTREDFDDLLPARMDLSEVGKAILRPDASLKVD